MSVQVEINGDEKKVVEELERDGKRYRVTSVYKVSQHTVELPKCVLERRKWKEHKFGKAKGALPGHGETATTSISDEILITFKKEESKPKRKDASMASKIAPGVKCRNCGGAHWTASCPNKSIMERTSTSQPEQVPSNFSSRPKRDDENSIRISNLHPDASEEDVRALCRDCGRIARCFVATDRNTGKGKGFSYVTFETRAGGEAAIARLHRFGYGNLLLNVDWSVAK
eukprot:m.13284 g.13284  ORF g.13284 m.13284 type:complete len:228 (-) comp4132_c0_seq1:185-868(-)